MGYRTLKRNLKANRYHFLCPKLKLLHLFSDLAWWWATTSIRKKHRWNFNIRFLFIGLYVSCFWPFYSNFTPETAELDIYKLVHTGITFGVFCLMIGHHDQASVYLQAKGLFYPIFGPMEPNQISRNLMIRCYNQTYIIYGLKIILWANNLICPNRGSKVV